MWRKKNINLESKSDPMRADKAYEHAPIPRNAIRNVMGMNSDLCGKEVKDQQQGSYTA